jgi:hypothetical protein
MFVSICYISSIPRLLHLKKGKENKERVSQVELGFAYPSEAPGSCCSISSVRCNV